MFLSAAGEDKSTKDKSASKDKAAGKIQILDRYLEEHVLGAENFVLYCSITV